MDEVSRALPSYVALLLYVLSTTALESTWQHMEPILGKGLAFSVTTGSAFAISVFFYALGRGSVRVSM